MIFKIIIFFRNLSKFVKLIMFVIEKVVFFVLIVMIFKLFENFIIFLGKGGNFWINGYLEFIKEYVIGLI